jgi:hypothetical protein
MEIDSSFELSINLTERAHGPDPHSNTFDILVDGTHVQYHGPYGEGTRGRYETESVEFELTDDQRTRLRRQVANYDLRQSVEETFHTDTDAMQYRDVDVEATIVVDGETYELRIEGILDAHGTDREMEHYQQARGLIALCREFNSWAEESEENA